MDEIYELLTKKHNSQREGGDVQGYFCPAWLSRTSTDILRQMRSW